ncbi:MAG: J domain-containing protein [Bacillales bacterium]|nr:J domain-containing protein [Bacillales bacterium]
MLLFIWIIFVVTGIVLMVSDNIWGTLFLVAGIILFTLWIVKRNDSKNKSNKEDNYHYEYRPTIINNNTVSSKGKIEFIRTFYANLIVTCPRDNNYLNNIKEIYQIINMFDTLSKMDYINSQLEQTINAEYKRIMGIYNDLEAEVERKHKLIFNCELHYSEQNMINIIHDAKNDGVKLIKVDNLLKFLLLLCNDKAANKAGYQEFNYTTADFPSEPEQIHIYAISCIATKSVIDDWNSPLAGSLLSLFNDVNDKEVLKKLVSDLYNRRLKTFEELFKKDGSKNILLIILFLDPTFSGEKYINSGLFERLGLTPDATREEVEKAYKKLLLTEHPDRGGNIKEWEKTNEAYAKIKENFEEK